jgi:hypothetical protein
MTLVIASKGSTHFPAPPNPSVPPADPLSGGVSGAVIGGPGINPLPMALAGCIGTLTINGAVISGNDGLAPGQLNLTVLQQQDVARLINGVLGGTVVADITPQGRLRLASLSGVQITIGGSANVLNALGFTAGGYIS